jgi:hypothetical protein
MALLKIDSRAFSHPKVTRAGNAAVGLWMRLACWSVSHHPGNWNVPQRLAHSYSTPVQLRRMVAAGLATPTPDGYELDAELLSFARHEYRAVIPAELRERIYNRDGHQCLKCAATDDLTLDHIHPWSLGGPDTEDNLRTLCRSCNSKKGAKV